MAYKPQYYPGNTSVARNRRKHMSNKIEKLRDISDEDLTAILGHRAPGSDYPSTHPPLSEMGEPDCSIREIVEPTPGAAAGDRVRYVQFADSMYNAPATPYWRSYHAAINFRGCDPGTLSGRQIVEMRERDLEAFAKRVSETEMTDWGLAGMRGCTVHGHSLRLQEDGTMFDMLDRRRLEGGVMVMDKDQVGVPIDRKVNLGKPMSESEAAKRTTIYRVDNVTFRSDMEVIEHVQRVWELRTGWGFSLFAKEHELTNPSGWQGTPSHMNYLLGRLFVVSVDVPSQDDLIGPRKCGYHTIRFDPETGFHWEGNFYDPNYSYLWRQPVVLTGDLALLQVGNNTVHVYNSSLKLVGQIRIEDAKDFFMIAMGADSRGNATLVSHKGNIYIYRVTPTGVKLDRKYSPMGETNILRAIVVSRSRILIEKPEGLFLLEWNMNKDDYEIFPVPTVPPDWILEPLIWTDKHVELAWYAGQDGQIGKWEGLVITGAGDGIRIFQIRGGHECLLVKYKDTNGELHDSYDLEARDWDFRFQDEYSHRGFIYMIAALRSGKLLVGTLDITLNPYGQSYFHIRSQELDPKGDVYCVFWARDQYSNLPSNPRFEILKDGSLRYKGTKMPAPINPTPSKKVNYGISVKTGGLGDAGTDANVYITLFGKYDVSEEILLDNPGHNDFEKGNTDYFYVNLINLGEIEKIRIRIGPDWGLKPGWFLDEIRIQDRDHGTWVFPCYRWLAEDEDDGKVDRILEAAQYIPNPL